MRSLFKLPGAALLAVAALFAVVALPSTANALTFRTDAVPAAVRSGPEIVQDVRFNWWQARRARHDVARTMYRDCRDSGNWRERRRCHREARNSLRELHYGARDTYTDCRGDGGNRRDCRQAVWQYWMDQAYNSSDPGGSGGTDGGAGDSGGDGEVTDDLPM